MPETVHTTGQPGQQQTGGDGAAGQAQEKAKEVASQAQDKAREAAGQARGRVREQVDQRSTQLGQQVTANAGDARSVAEELRSKGKDTPARYVEQAADRAERLGGYLEQSDGGRILSDVEDFARRNPWAVAAGGLALGFAAARMLKASSSERYRSSLSAGNGSAGLYTGSTGVATGSPGVATGSPGVATGSPGVGAAAVAPSPSPGRFEPDTP